MGSITAHVMHQAVLIGLRVLGSTATIQGGTKLVGSVITGLEELGSGFRGLSDGDVVGVGVGVLGLGKNVAGGVLNAGNAVLGIAGDIAGTNVVTRHTVGALIAVYKRVSVRSPMPSMQLKSPATDTSCSDPMTTGSHLPKRLGTVAICLQGHDPCFGR